MKIYIDHEFHCHTSNPDGAFREIKDDFFDNKCASFVEGHCYDDRSGHVRIYPWKPYDELAAAQAEYEKEQRFEALEAKNAALESENTMLNAQVSALSDQMDFYEECIVEMAEVVYA